MTTKAKTKTLRVTKADIDNLAQLELAMKEQKKLFAAAEKKYKTALSPVLDYLDLQVKLPPTKGAELRGKRYVLEFGAKRVQRFLKDTVEALRRLEAVRQGLGYENISIALGVLDKELRADEVEDIIGKEYGGRVVKATFVGDPTK